MLGGVTIPFHLGLLGHSDADALAHAAMDAMLGACALGDIGKLFPDTDPQYAGICSLTLLTQVLRRTLAQGYALSNLDATIVAPAAQAGPPHSRHAGQAGRRYGLRPGADQHQSHHPGRLRAGRGAGIHHRALRVQHGGNMTNHPTITIAPLSIPGAMSQAAWRCIQQADALFLQTDQSPCARPVLDTGLAYRSMDDLYASAQDFDQLNQAIARAAV